MAFHLDFLLDEVKALSWIVLFVIVIGQKILYGITIANEMADHANKWIKELTMFKVTFEKAYDSL